MTLQINLSWWAQAILVLVLAIGALAGKVSWNWSSTTEAANASIALKEPQLPKSIDGWTTPTSNWLAQTAVGQ